MMGSGLGKLAALVLAAFVALVALPGSARASHLGVIERSCVAYGSLGADPAKAVSAITRWDCSGKRASLEPERVFFRFALPEAGHAPEYATFRRAAFERLHLLVVDADGTVRSTNYRMNDMNIGKAGAFIRADLPQVTAQSRYAIAVLDLPTHSMMLDSMQLGAGEPGDNPAEFKLLLLLAALCGMLLMPLAFNLAFYRVLREQFLLWHAGLAMTLLATIVLTSGVSAYVVDLGMGTVNALMSLIYGAVVATGAMFAWAFIEPGKLHPWLRRALPACAVWSMAVCAWHAFFPFMLRPIQVDLAYAAFLPILAVFFWSVIDASRRGSRAVMFQIAGWMPLMLVALLRILSQVVPVVHPTDAMVLFYFGVVFEALATTLGVADRFLTIRRQRDMARTEADMLERLSEHDPLTGLLNRRAIEPDFAELRTAGFDTFALLDLDHFKRINDDFGHAVGDKVLRAVGEALQNQPDTMAVRLGGEEFALLMRGDDTQERAERMRQSIPVRVARGVPELDRVVTASMGLLELPRSGLKGVGFKEFYAKADKLLYEAKSGGRNRLIAERMRVFVPRKIERRRAA
jgi:diguanylate cyclase (GGDEF)-like protein